ncbi:MAG: hypothetical protein AB8B64_16580 [Granulosicoccus sp.]
MHNVLSMIFLTAAILGTSNVFAFNSERNGFLLGLGFGVSQSTVTIDYFDSQFLNQNPASMEFSETDPYLYFRIGGGIGRKATLYFLTSRNRNTNVEYGFLGLGGTYYFMESSQSFYLNGGIGLGFVNTDDVFASDGSGDAYILGVGYEPTRGLHLELNLMQIDADEGSSFTLFADADYDFFATQFIVGYTWF